MKFINRNWQQKNIAKKQRIPLKKCEYSYIGNITFLSSSVKNYLSSKNPLLRRKIEFSPNTSDNKKTFWQFSKDSRRRILLTEAMTSYNKAYCHQKETNSKCMTCFLSIPELFFLFLKELSYFLEFAWCYFSCEMSGGFRFK